jgi:hypothetical protein
MYLGKLLRVMGLMDIALYVKKRDHMGTMRLDYELKEMNLEKV